MSHPGKPDPAAAAPMSLSYSASLRKAFNFGAFVVALLPVPIIYFNLLPAYRVHSYFLIFYAPLVCLLTLGYLFYVRDSLARMMFAHLLDPLPRPMEFYPERSGMRLRRLFARVRSSLLALLPAVLLVGSFACVMRYTVRLNESISAASVALADRLTPPEDVGVVSPGSSAEGPTDKADPPNRRAGPKQVTDTANDSAQVLAEGTDLRQRTLEFASIDEIPHFTELTLLFILSFFSALVALVLMGLREYAKEALGLSERDVVLGRVLAEPE